MSKRNVFYGQPDKIYRALDFICPYCYHRPLSKDELSKYTGNIVLTYADKSQGYAKVNSGVVDGVFVLYERNVLTPAMRGHFEKGYAEGTWKFHKRVKGVWVDVEVDYLRGKVVDKPPRVEPKSAIALLKMGEFRAPNLQKTMAFKLPLKMQCHWTRMIKRDIENTHE